MGLLLLSLLKKIIKILANNSKPKQIAISICFGMLIGLVPFNTLFYLFLFLAICILPTNIVAISLGMIIYNPFSYLIYPLADSLGYYDKKEGIKTKYIPTLPISQMASIQVGSFDKNVNLEVDGKVNTPTKPTGVFGSRDERKRKSLTQLYSKRVYSFSRKSSPLAGSMKSRLKGRSNVTMGDL